MGAFRGNLFLKKRHYGMRLRRVMILMLVSAAPRRASSRPP